MWQQRIYVFWRKQFFVQDIKSDDYIFIEFLGIVSDDSYNMDASKY